MCAEISHLPLIQTTKNETTDERGRAEIHTYMSEGVTETTVPDERRKDWFREQEGEATVSTRGCGRVLRMMECVLDPSHALDLSYHT